MARKHKWHKLIEVEPQWLGLESEGISIAVDAKNGRLIAKAFYDCGIDFYCEFSISLDELGLQARDE